MGLVWGKEEKAVAPEPTTKQRFAELANLEAGWADEGAKPISPHALHVAWLIRTEWPGAHVIPLADGGIQLETAHIELEIQPDGSIGPMLFAFGDAPAWTQLAKRTASIKSLAAKHGFPVGNVKEQQDEFDVLTGKRFSND